MTTNTTESFTTEAMIRALTRRAVTILLRDDYSRREALFVIDGIAEAMTVLQLVDTPFAFTIAFFEATQAAGAPPAVGMDGARAAWIDRVIALVYGVVA